MNSPIIYLDNAATTYPKPEEVYLALDREMRRSGNSGRGAHTLALNCARTIFESRESIADFLGVSRSERLIFTPGCTQSLNVVLNSFCANKALLQSGGIILLSGLEHNSIMRPLHALKARFGFGTEVLPYTAGAFCDLNDLETALRKFKPAMFILTEGSNVTGEIADWSAVADLCKKYAVPLLIDAAQTAGRFPSCLAHEGITFWCASAHKGLMGPQGLGLLYVHPDFSLDPLVMGGTGSASEHLVMPDVYPDHLEPGTMPAFLIAGLNAGVSWLKGVTVDEVVRHENSLAHSFLSWASEAPFIKVYGGPQKSDFLDVAVPDVANVADDPDDANDQNDPNLPNNEISLLAKTRMPRLPTVSFEVHGKSADVVADYLDRTASIAVRSGLHCSLQAHRALGTESTGLVRASFGFFNTIDDVDRLCETLRKLGK
jgi:cysteine desulfurase / selenocysteine lyase